MPRSYRPCIVYHLGNYRIIGTSLDGERKIFWCKRCGHVAGVDDVSWIPTDTHGLDPKGRKIFSK